MKRVNINVFGMFYHSMILITNMDELYEFFENSLQKIQEKSLTKLIDRSCRRIKGEFVGHPDDILVSTSEKMSQISGKGCLYTHTEMFENVYSLMINKVSKGEYLAINPNTLISYFSFNPEIAEIEYISENDCYTKDDIKVFRWDNGIHWYAKVDKYDVVINGEQKWNSKLKAKQKAEEFLEQFKPPNTSISNSSSSNVENDINY